MRRLLFAVALDSNFRFTISFEFAYLNSSVKFDAGPIEIVSHRFTKNYTDHFLIRIIRYFRERSFAPCLRGISPPAH